MLTLNKKFDLTLKEMEQAASKIKLDPIKAMIVKSSLATINNFLKTTKQEKLENYVKQGEDFFNFIKQDFENEQAFKEAFNALKDTWT